MFPREFTPELAATMLMQGDCAAVRSDYETAVHMYDTAILIFEETHGDENPELIGPLLRLANAYEQLGRVEVHGTIMERARQIAEINFSCEALRPIEH